MRAPPAVSFFAVTELPYGVPGCMGLRSAVRGVLLIARDVVMGPCSGLVGCPGTRRRDLARVGAR